MQSTENIQIAARSEPMIKAKVKNTTTKSPVYLSLFKTGLVGAQCVLTLDSRQKWYRPFNPTYVVININKSQPLTRFIPDLYPIKTIYNLLSSQRITQL